MVDNTMKIQLTLDTVNRNHSIDSLRVFLVVIVVVFHVAQSFGYNRFFSGSSLTILLACRWCGFGSLVILL
jgi:peptidoglycan/LPS O-acetylase OafA/YrhL